MDLNIKNVERMVILMALEEYATRTKDKDQRNAIRSREERETEQERHDLEAGNAP